MYSIVSTAIVRGIESIPIRVEADVTDGMPVFEMVGFLSAGFAFILKIYRCNEYA